MCEECRIVWNFLLETRKLEGQLEATVAERSMDGGGLPHGDSEGTGTLRNLAGVHHMILWTRVCFILPVSRDLPWTVLNSTIINELTCVMEEKVHDKFRVSDKDSGTKQLCQLKRTALLMGVLIAFSGPPYRLDEPWPRRNHCTSSRQQNWTVLKAPSMAPVLKTWKIQDSGVTVSS